MILKMKLMGMSNQSNIPQNTDLFKNADSHNSNNISMYVLIHQRKQTRGNVLPLPTKMFYENAQYSLAKKIIIKC